MIIQKGEENIVEKMMSELQDFTAKTPFQPLFLNYSNQTRDRQTTKREGWVGYSYEGNGKKRKERRTSFEVTERSRREVE